ncbi:hypothetical protein PIB30_057486 [Stylosanthes scabra]|uniref:Uncharacterized protein n=1 Tax=Stylosanthes scabra TaxID=79078 RepID=A0ABU6UJ07_9FABA|nr:hypothetical protein [Stylosanthes scabra]
MGTFKSRGFSLVPFYIFLLTLFTCTHSSTSQDICKRAFCGMGTCEETSTGIQGYKCNCNPGWSTVDLGLFTSACIFPNCTFDSECHVSVLPPSPHPPPMPAPCFFCGNATCEAKSLLDVVCHCNEGFDNILNNPHFPCFPQCAKNAKCSDGIELFPQLSPSPSPQQYPVR